jgi:hypothetical protein
MIADENNWSRLLAAAMYLHGVNLSSSVIDEAVFKRVAAYMDDLRLLPEAWAVAMASEVLGVRTGGQEHKGALHAAN